MKKLLVSLSVSLLFALTFAYGYIDPSFQNSGINSYNTMSGCVNCDAGSHMTGKQPGYIIIPPSEIRVNHVQQYLPTECTNCRTGYSVTHTPFCYF